MKSKLPWSALILVLGFLAGAYLFAGVQRRSILDAPGCGDSCFESSEVLGLVASAGIRHARGFIPNVIKESNHCLAMEHPRPQGDLHLVIFPKRDIKDIASLSADDGPAILDCLGLIASLVRERKLRRYVVYTNGPRRQDVRYLHFHLVVR